MEFEFIDLKRKLVLTEEILKQHLLGTLDPPLVQIYFPSPNSLRNAVYQDKHYNFDLNKSLLIDEAILAFYNTIELSYLNPFIRQLVKPRVAYASETCTQLFIESLNKAEKPRLVPRMDPPSREACEKLIRAFTGKLPFESID